MMTTSYSLLYDVIKPVNDFDPTATFDQNSPPELLHDSEEDDGDSLSSAQHEFSPHSHHHSDNNNSSNNDDRQRRKSIPHRSPSMIQDVFLANNNGTLGTSFVFQWDSPKVNHGGSLLSALRSKVALARQQQRQHRINKKRAIHHPRRQLTATCIALPTHHDHQYSITQRRLSVPQVVVPASLPLSPPPLSPPPLSPSEPSPSAPSPSPLSPPAMPSPKKSVAPSESDHNTSSITTTPARHTSSGRPSRVKGPCQACNETSDGCMRKAFDWPFPANQIFNDKGRPFVYLCNKCGLRYNKSRGCVCRHCRWVFCKEEKRKAMQYIDKMRRNRSGKVDLDDEIEGFVCSPKYWSCGRPWKVRWVLNDHPEVDEDE